VQANSGLVKPLDARSLAQDVVVPFDREHHTVLGGSPEPYANNPLRIPAITTAARAAQKFKEDFDDILRVLDFAQTHQDAVGALLDLVLREVAARLATTQITYPIPNRSSLAQTTNLLTSYLQEKSGGLRLQAVATALFRVIGSRFSIFTSVQSHVINAADASTGGAADIECTDANKVTVLAVEVKDRQLTFRHVSDKLPLVRERAIRELLFLVKGGVEARDQEPLVELQRHEFTSGQNIYVCEFETFLTASLVLFGEPGRRALLEAVGMELNTVRADFGHRKAWRDALAAV
jgi:hypothetical protein